jgi:hypothetical protein
MEASATFFVPQANIKAVPAQIIDVDDLQARRISAAGNL